jgi:hypothetical protein
MDLTPAEIQFLTALVREQNQTGCRGPAHDLLRTRLYPDAPTSGPGSLTFSYEAVPLTSMLLRDMKDLDEIDNFLRMGERNDSPSWPWNSPHEFRARLAQARQEWESIKKTPGMPVPGTPPHIDAKPAR